MLGRSLAVGQSFVDLQLFVASSKNFNWASDDLLQAAEGERHLPDLQRVGE